MKGSFSQSQDPVHPAGSDWDPGPGSGTHIALRPKGALAAGLAALPPLCFLASPHLLSLCAFPSRPLWLLPRRPAVLF